MVLIRCKQDVLQKEAVVQNDPSNARAWFELGVKQQENEREKEAIEALRRAVHFEPAMLDAWLALAVSFTNEGQLGDAYDAIEQWISNTESYRHVIANIGAKKADASTRERCDSLLEAMMTIIRSNPEVDADTQVALAVLLNTTEVCKMFWYSPIPNQSEGFRKSQRLLQSSLGG